MLKVLLHQIEAIDAGFRQAAVSVETDNMHLIEADRLRIDLALLEVDHVRGNADRHFTKDILLEAYQLLPMRPGEGIAAAGEKHTFDALALKPAHHVADVLDAETLPGSARCIRAPNTFQRAFAGKVKLDLPRVMQMTHPLHVKCAQDFDGAELVEITRTSQDICGMRNEPIAHSSAIEALFGHDCPPIEQK